MNEQVEGKTNVSIVLPDVIYAPQWQAYARRRRNASNDEDAITVNYEAALEVLEGGTFEVGGVVHDIKTTPLDQTPLDVMVWVGNRTLIYVNAQFDIEKNSSAPSSEPPPPTSTSG